MSGVLAGAGVLGGVLAVAPHLPGPQQPAASRQPEACLAGGAATGTVPPAPPGCDGATATFEEVQNGGIPGIGVITRTIAVSGMPAWLWDLNLRTSITHQANADLDITLTSPAGTVVTVTSDNGGESDNVFNGTTWDDGADPGGQVPYASNGRLVTDAAYANLVVQTPLVPEEAFGAFIGENPNGTWTLTISDDAIRTPGACTPGPWRSPRSTKCR
jgi:hypothetical protein